MRPKTFGAFRLRASIWPSVLAVLTVSSHAHAVSVGDTTLVAIQLGFTPETLCVAGADATETAALLSRLRQAGEDRAVVAQTAETLCTASQQIAWLRESLRRTPQASELASQLGQARSGMAAARAGREAARSALLETATEETESGLAERVASAARALAAGLPAEFGAAELSPTESRKVALAAIAERRAERLGRELDAPSRDLLAAVREDSRVIAAAGRLAERAAAVSAAFEQSRLLDAQTQPPR